MKDIVCTNMILYILKMIYNVYTKYSVKDFDTYFFLSVPQPFPYLLAKNITPWTSSYIKEYLVCYSVSPFPCIHMYDTEDSSSHIPIDIHTSDSRLEYACFIDFFNKNWMRERERWQ